MVAYGIKKYLCIINSVNLVDIAHLSSMKNSPSADIYSLASNTPCIIRS